MISRTVLTMTGLSAVLALGVGPARAEEGSSSPEATLESTSQAQPRFGVGWDDGVALRFRLSPRWGVGLRVNPDLVDADESARSSYTYQYETDDSSSAIPPFYPRWSSSYLWESDGNDDRKTFALSAMLYHERRFGRWFAAGPYLALNYTRMTYDSTQRVYYKTTWEDGYSRIPRSGDNEEWADIQTHYWERNLGVELGVRPVLPLHEHFAIETRFGVEMLFSKWNEDGQQSNRWESPDSEGGVAMPTSAPVPAPAAAELLVRGGGQGTSDNDFDRSGSSTRFRAVGDRVISDFQIRLVVYF